MGAKRRYFRVVPRGGIEPPTLRFSVAVSRFPLTVTLGPHYAK